jgi:hypothetical protein
MHNVKQTKLMEAAEMILSTTQALLCLMKTAAEDVKELQTCTSAVREAVKENFDAGTGVKSILI